MRCNRLDALPPVELPAGYNLCTDDWRLPAVKTYLNLGFEPEIIHESHPARWKAVFETLGVAVNDES